LRSNANTETLKRLTEGLAEKVTKPGLSLRLKIWVLLKHHFQKKAISLILGCHIKTVYNLNKRLVRGEGIEDRNRCGRPPIIRSDVTHRLIAFYCQRNPLPGCTRWSINWAAKFLKKNPHILKCTISRASVYRLLSSHALRPYRTTYFLQIRDIYFFEKMEKIIRVYGAGYKLLFCLDECTGLQAIERIAPYLPAYKNHNESKEFEYIRHGTVSIISFLEVATGKVFTECIPNHTSSTVIQVIRRHVNQYDSSETLHYILDNYSSHSTEEFCKDIARLCDVKLPELKGVAERKEWLESENKRIVFHFLPTHGSWLNLIEIWFGILKEKCIKDENFNSVVDLMNHIISFTDTWNKYFAHPFGWTYNGEDLYGKVIRRVVKWIQMENNQLTQKFLKIQLGLISHLADKYWGKADIDDWESLQKTIREKKTFIRTLIKNDKEIKHILINLEVKILKKLEYSTQIQYNKVA
jgi:transposase